MNVRKLLLAEYQSQVGIPFVWGSADCVTFCADCAKLILGRDVIEKWRGQWDSEISANKLMLAEGWRSTREFAAAQFSEIPVAQARSGDWAFVVNEDQTSGLGVVCGDRIMVRAPAGIGAVPLTQASAAFRVE